MANREWAPILRLIPVVPVVALLGACGSDGSSPVEAPPISVPPEATEWLNSVAVPFEGTHLSLAHNDLEILRDYVGDARIVALGENTHGTRDFFEMKARILRFLVEEMDFDAFLIEATWPESNRLDRYVRTGNGDPFEYLSGLYFWTWNTESVMEMIQWMRSHNIAGGNVGFYGFDMQYPGMALDNVIRYVGEVDADVLPETEASLSCLVQYANNQRGRFPSPRYDDAGTVYKKACGASLSAEARRLENNRDAYVAKSGPKDFALALQSLRVALQYHLMVLGEQTRDQSMAENTAWWLEQLGPESRVVLWAHNFHVSTLSGAQGSFLDATFGDDMVVFGFSHEEGTFHAVTLRGGEVVARQDHSLPGVLRGSYEDFFSTAEAPRFFVDLRGRDLTDPSASWLSGPRRLRSIGCCYDPDQSGSYWRTVPLPAAFDVMIHVRQTRATKELSFQYPSAF